MDIIFNAIIEKDFELVVINKTKKEPIHGN